MQLLVYYYYYYFSTILSTRNKAFQSNPIQQRIIETLLQKVSENVRPIQQVENTTFNNDVEVINECKLMKDCVKNANI